LAWAGDLARMLQVSIVVYMVTAAALSMAYFELIYILIALVSRCRRIVEFTLAAQSSPETAPLKTSGQRVTGAPGAPLPRPPRWAGGTPVRAARWSARGTATTGRIGGQ
jgi:putative inorganic carbon (HCO3(-)) transporter